MRDGLGMPLSHRQREVMEAYARTGDRRAAADLLGISPNTLANHVHAALERLGALSAIEGFALLGWLRPGGWPSEVVAEAEARLSAIHADTGALLAELRA